MEVERNSDGWNYIQMLEPELPKKRKSFLDLLNEGNN